MIQILQTNYSNSSGVVPIVKQAVTYRPSKICPRQPKLGVLGNPSSEKWGSWVSFWESFTQSQYLTFSGFGETSKLKT